MARILMVIPHLGYGGAEGSFLRLAESLAGDHDVTIAIMAQGFGADYRDIEVETRIPVVVLRSSMHGSRRGLPGSLAGWWDMIRRLRSLKKDSDVTISFLSGANLLNVLSGSCERVIVSERGSKRSDIGMSARERFLWTRILDPLIYRRARFIVAASEGLAHEIRSSNPWAAPRLLSIEGSIDAKALIAATERPVEEELAWLADHETIVSFGRMHVQKGFDFLLEAFAEVRSRRPRARLLLIGDGPEEKALEELAVRLGLEVGSLSESGDVIFLGHRHDPARYLKLARVFAFPSRFEGLANALIEAVGAGLPVLASDCPWGTRTILSDGEMESVGEAALPMQLRHGLLMPHPDSPAALAIWSGELAAALERSVTRPDEAVREQAIQRYSIAETGPRWARLVQVITADPALSRARARPGGRATAG